MTPNANHRRGGHDSTSNAETACEGGDAMPPASL